MKHFLMKDPFGNYLARVYYEWMQARDEGRAVEPFEAGCKMLQDAFADPDERQLAQWSEAAHRMGEVLAAAPVKADFPYTEPSDLAGIERESELGSLADEPLPADDAALTDRLIGGWTGNAAGCLLGKPIEFMRRGAIREMLEATGNYPIGRYPACREFSPQLIEKLGLRTGVVEQPWLDECDGHAAPADDDTNYSVLNLKVAETYGLGFEPNDVLFSWLYWLPACTTYTAERAAYVNASRGMTAPATASFENPFREWIGALIRAAAPGMLNPGRPQAAARMAFRDACVSHTRNGIYGEMMAAAMLARAMTGAGARDIVLTGMKAVPKRSRLYEALQGALADHDAGLTNEQAIDRLHARWDEGNLFEWCHVIPNAVILALSLLYADGDFAAAIGMSVQAGFDTDSTTAIVGAIAGAALGKSRMPPYWGDAFGNRLRSSVAGYAELSMEQLAHKTLSLIRGTAAGDDRIKAKFDYKEQFDQ